MGTKWRCSYKETLASRKKGFFKGSIDVGIGVDADMDIDSDMLVLQKLGVLLKLSFRPHLKGFGVEKKADLELIFMRAIWLFLQIWEPFFVGVLVMRDLLLGVCIGTPYCWKLPFEGSLNVWLPKVPSLSKHTELTQVARSLV